MHWGSSLCRGRNRTHGLKERLHLPDVRRLAEQQVLEKFIDLLVVGGVNEDNVASFLAAGAIGAGIGGNLVNAAWVKAGQYEKITETARLLVDSVK